MDENAWLADRFEEHRAHLRAVAYRMLGSLADADDAGQELHPALVNGTAGVVVTMHGRPLTGIGFTVSDGNIVEIDTIADADRVRVIAASVLPGT
jgi:hypothetical protein